MEAKKVKVEVVDKGEKRSYLKLNSISTRIKLGIAIVLDVIDFLLGWLPIANTAWDFVTFIVLLLILKNKRLAFLSLAELPLLGLPPFSIFDMFIPIATITVLIDNGIRNIKIRKFGF